MTKKKNTSMIGHDPQAWINAPTDSEEASPQEKASDDTGTVAIDDAEQTGEDEVVMPLEEDNQAEQLAEQASDTSHAEAETIADVLDAVAGEPVDVAAQGVVTLEGDLTIQSVQTLHDLLSSALEQTGDVVVDASDVGRVDTAAMQTLYAFAKNVNDGDRDFSWAGESASIKEVAASLGMSAMLKV